MRRIILIAGVFALCQFCSAARSVCDVLPKPASIRELSGKPLVIGNAPKVSIHAAIPDSVRIARAVMRLWPEAAICSEGDVAFRIDRAIKGTDAYRIKVASGKATVSAATGAGLFYGLQTLSQLENNGRMRPVEITDSARFPYRGLLLDVSRHFRDKEFVKKQLDAMGRLKLNKLQFHLTDGAGWRLQIDRYPLLTRFGAWRKGATWKEWNDNGNRYLPEGDPEASGGYYTKEDIREILEYAADRYITVIPEIEMPSHSEEVLAAYPMLTCTKTPYTSSDFCPGSEATFEFIENVLDEVIRLFPSRYINIGGDEAGKAHWASCPDCRRRMEQEGISDVDGLQSYLIHRIERYLNSKGRDLIGWDEIMEGGLSPTASVVSWRGTDKGLKAAAQGNNVVMAPGRYLYFDSYQDAPHTQPEAFGGYLPIADVYAYDPAPAALPDSVRRHISGIEATLFAEYLTTPEHAEYMLYPRALALAEVAWTPQHLRDFGDFRTRAVKMSEQMRAHGYNSFDLTREYGNRKEALSDDNHLARGKKVSYNVKWWSAYPAQGETTLTDGQHGGWNYSDRMWQGFIARDKRMDVTIDLESVMPLQSIGADFMQICGPGVYFPKRVEISVSDDGIRFRHLATINHDVERTDGVSFKNFGWHGSDRGRFIRYEAFADEGCLFTDEIAVR